MMDWHTEEWDVSFTRYYSDVRWELPDVFQDKGKHLS